MTDDAKGFIKKSVDHRENGRLEEAVLTARHATTLDPKDANAWWQLALSIYEKDGIGSAFPHFKKTTELAPSFSYGWYRLGEAYKKTAQLNEAIASWEESIELDDGRADSLVALLHAYREREREGDEHKVFKILKTLDAQNKLPPGELNALGVEFHKRKEYYKSVIYFRRYAIADGGPIGFYNLGLAYSAAEIGQDADAIDSWRRALQQDPTYAKAQTNLDRVIQPLLGLASRLRENSHVLTQDLMYLTYINPYELLNLSDVDDASNIDIKIVQKAKKLLLQEIELEDGNIEWMHGLKIDRSRALQVADELSDESKSRHHLLVYKSKSLLNFLSKGHLDHFLVDADESPTLLLNAIEDSTDSFAAWLSTFFAPQYDLLLTKAIEAKNMDAIECLLDGRRWVVAEDEDSCFDGARRQVQRLLKPLQDGAEKFENLKPSLASVTAVINSGKAGPILSVLPSAFQKEQTEAASLVRRISISAYNQHGDADLAKEIAELARSFASRSPSLRHRIDEDVATLNERITEERKNETSLTLKGTGYSIKRDGVRFGSQFIPTDKLETVRWGISISRSGSITTYAYSMVIGGTGASVATVSWSVIHDIKTQTDLFNEFVNACFAYVLPAIHEKLNAQMEQGSTIRFGPVTASRSGVTFTVNGWFNSRTELCPWKRLNAQITNGNLVIFDSADSKLKSTLTLSEVDNAYVLYVMIQNKK